MTIKVYGVWYSSATNRVLTLLLEKEIEFELIPVDVLTGEHKQPEYLALQPFAQIPALQDGDLTMFESCAILRYICEKYLSQGTLNLHGSTLIEKARVEQWLEVESQNTSPTVYHIFNELTAPYFLQREADHGIIVESTEKLGKILDVYEAHLSKNKYLAGDL